MTKILLVSLDAKYIHSNLAIYDLQAYALCHGYRTDRREFTINQPEDYILAELYQEQAQVVCFSCYIWNIERILRIAEDLSLAAPGTEIWLGGPEAGFRAEELMERYPFLSGIMTGEGEESFRKLCGFFREGRPEPGEIPGLVFRRSGIYQTEPGEQGSSSPVRTEPGEQGSGSPVWTSPAEHGSGSLVRTPPGECLAMDEIPFCYEVLEDLSLENRIVYYESSRGCPFSCSYCLSSVDRRVRFRSLPLVFRELQYFIDREVPLVKFVDRTFNCSHDRTLKIIRFLSDHDRGKTGFHFEVAAELLSEEEIRLLNSLRPGLVQLEIGVQTTYPPTLDAICRRSSRDRLEEVVRRLREPGNIHLHLDLIAGLPEEGLERFGQSFDDVFRMRPDQLQLGFLKLLRGSPLYERREEYGLVCHPRPPYEVISTRWLSYGDVLVLKRTEAVLEEYFNSGQFTRSLPYLMSFFPSPFAFFRALGDCRHRAGGEAAPSSRLQKYQLLLDFAEETAGRAGDSAGHGGDSAPKQMQPEEALHRKERYSPERMKEYLTWDLYLRENLKKRAPWMPDPRDVREELRGICRRNHLQTDRNCHLEPFDHLEGESGRVYAIFDYTARDPLSGNAEVRILSEKCF